jgi:hypothetical protein
LPDFSTQAALFSTAGLSASLFTPTDRYRLFAKLVYPHLAASRAALAKCYCGDNGRVALEPVLMLGVSILVSRQSRQRLDSTQMFGRVSKMNRLDCVRESLRLALREVAPGLAEAGTTVVGPKGKGQLASDRVQNPHDPEATYAVKGQGQQKKEHVGYKIQVAETVSEAVLAPGETAG